MEILGAIITKFQANLIMEYAEILFVALVMVIANDDSAKCREMAAQLIRSLIERLDDERRNTFMSHLHTWSGQYTQPQLVRVSSQVYGIVIEALQTEVSPYMSVILKDVNDVLKHGSEQLNAVDADDDAMDVDVDWQASYYSLIVLSKLVGAFPVLITQSNDIDWRLIVNHLLFPHAWVRTASCRLLGTLFGASAVQIPLADPETMDQEFSPYTRSGMKEIAQKLCTQLKSEHLDEGLSLQVVKCLFFIGKCYALVPFQNVEEEANKDNGEDEGDEEEDTGDQQGNDLPWLFSKLSYQLRSAIIARRNRSSSKPNWFHQPLSVIRWFAAMASHLEADVLGRFLVHILSPIYRVTEDDTIHDPKMGELKDLSTELQDLIQSKVGTTKFTQVYTQIRQGVAKVRRERKEARVLQVATNPQAAASRKMHKNAVKKESKKRKNREFVEGKGKLKRRREA
ncbi:hypothetical protein D9758_002677 [Tetrapyrgos nigripes]|uniref:U3 small nucleolar RNA-associated protein 20 C-terminal domain-containing protein n=1 Tax=Tetrapyrgos nigripes TaxID=182062 RepID=A0A8H5GQS6_9AGAR|nr:hypothetical protein D9758_002677 [Tetrapyrgos nigripes]